MGNSCVVCGKSGRDIRIISVVDIFQNFYTKVNCHYECFPTCECGEVYCVNKRAEWAVSTYHSGIRHMCIKESCVSCKFPIYNEKFYATVGKMWHTRCHPSEKNWPICNEISIANKFRSFPREYRKYMLFQYWALRKFIRDKNIIWKIVALAVYPYGYATNIQNGIPIGDINPSCKCGELKQYLTNYTPRCINGCVNYNIDQICQILNIPTNITRDQKLTLIKKILFFVFR